MLPVQHKDRDHSHFFALSLTTCTPHCLFWPNVGFSVSQENDTPVVCLDTLADIQLQKLFRMSCLMDDTKNVGVTVHTLCCCQPVSLIVMLQLQIARTGDIVALGGLKDVITGETLCDEKSPIMLERMEFPDPVIKVHYHINLTMRLCKHTAACTMFAVHTRLIAGITASTLIPL